ncbi:protein translocase subunit SecF [Gudongella sp. DL1XJH-153]|uniref:protein translocase subunit SecF n=1 Tax=Gudongella sp. DL1XJH-153 TaxID=3409804 RepID=UPI003BB61EC7
MNIIKNRKYSYIVSLAIILAGLIMFFINGLNYGIDFTGGTMIQLNIGSFVEVNDARTIMDEFDDKASIIHAGSNKEELIIRSSLDLENNEISEIVNGFVNQFQMDPENYQAQKFGAFMGREIRDRAIMSVGIAALLMLAYISIRFQFKFGLAAIAALIHDILIALSIYSILRLPVNSSFIAAMLTIVGYSINDTIVIFDRIREELKNNGRKTLEETINGSVKLSLRRTINTTITTIIAVGALYVLGVEDVKVLALPLLLGMLSGTYSSLFIATPVWFSLKKGKTI